jgi:hypothetical protein
LRFLSENGMAATLSLLLRAHSWVVSTSIPERTLEPLARRLADAALAPSASSRRSRSAGPSMDSALRQDILGRRSCQERGGGATAREGVAGNEGRGIYRLFGYREDQLADEVWLDRASTECAPLDHAGQPGVIVHDCREG